MVIKTYDAYTRLSTMEANRFTNFLFEHQEGKRATKKAIRKAIHVTDNNQCPNKHFFEGYGFKETHTEMRLNR